MLGWQLKMIDYLSIVNIACKYIYVSLFNVKEASGMCYYGKLREGQRQT